MLRWKTEALCLKELQPYDKNPRTITPSNKKRLAKDIKSVGNFRPIVVDTKNVILAGNQRYRVLLEKHGKDYEVEVTKPSRKLTEEERKKVIILDNKHRGMDDPEMLAKHFRDVLVDLEFAVKLRSAEAKLDEETKKIDEGGYEYDKTRVLISVKPGDFKKVRPLLNKIKRMEDIDYEQSSS
jgi:ParB-like chromosome segregation protein Spo0J